MTRTLERSVQNLAALAPPHLDLTDERHLDSVQTAADQLLSAAPDGGALRELERGLIGGPARTPLWVHLAIKLARSKLLVSSLEEEAHLSVVFAMYKEHLRIRRRSRENPVGEDFLRRKALQLDWLTADNPRIDWRIVAVDDGCPEGSGEIARQIARDMETRERIEVLFLEEAIRRAQPVTSPLRDVSGSQKGGSILLGLAHAAQRSESNHVLLLTDADLSTHLGQSGLLLAPIVTGAARVAVGSRREPTSVVVKQGRRDTRGKLFIYLWKQLLPVLDAIVDTQCGFKAFDAGLVPEIVADSLEKGFAFDIELLLRTELGYPGTTTKVPIAWIDSEAASTTTDLEPYLPMLRTIVTFYRHYLPSDSRSEEFAALIDNLDEASWNRLIDRMPAAIAEGDPAQFSRQSATSAVDLESLIQSP